MKIAVVEDEKLARERLERMLKSLGEEYNLFEDGVSLLEFESLESFSLFILDINMPKISGIELAFELKSRYPQAAIIFQTAYEHYAIKAFEIGAIDYLLKPFTQEQLKNSLDRVVQKLQIENELTFMTKNGDEFYILRPSDIFYITAELTEVSIRSSDGFSYYNKKISQMEEILSKYGFFKVHRSILINTKKIKFMKSGEQSKLLFSFEGIKDVVESSKDGAKKFRESTQID